MSSLYSIQGRLFDQDIDPYDPKNCDQFDSFHEDNIDNVDNVDNMDNYGIESSESGKSWKTQHGKKVHLIESDEPWYIHKKCPRSTPPPDIPSEDINENCSGNDSKNWLDFNLIACVLILLIIILLVLRLYINNKIA